MEIIRSISTGPITLNWTGAYIHHKFEFKMSEISLQKWNLFNQEYTCSNQGFSKMRAMVQLGWWLSERGKVGCALIAGPQIAVCRCWGHTHKNQPISHLCWGHTQRSGGLRDYLQGGKHFWREGRVLRRWLFSRINENIVQELREEKKKRASGNKGAPVQMSAKSKQSPNPTSQV